MSQLKKMEKIILAIVADYENIIDAKNIIVRKRALAQEIIREIIYQLPENDSRAKIVIMYLWKFMDFCQMGDEDSFEVFPIPQEMVGKKKNKRDEWFDKSRLKGSARIINFILEKSGISTDVISPTNKPYDLVLMAHVL